MQVTRWLSRTALAVALFASSLAFAQGTAVITGTVIDAATSKAVPDVVVTATSPALQGEQIVVTDEAGLYRIPQLPPGVYTLKLEKESYKLFTRADINVRADRTVRVNVQMQPEAVQGEDVVVVGKPPTVDIGSTATGITVGKDFINNIPFIQPNANGVKTFESLAAVAPQVVDDDFGYGFSGAQSPENLYVVDGLSVSDPALGLNGAQFPVEFVEEANVITGGYQAEYGRATGGVLSVVTQSGSNEFHGSVWGDWSPGILAGNVRNIPNDASVFVLTDGRAWNQVDFGVKLGGPILKDKLWFFVGFSPSWDRVQQTRQLRRYLTNDTRTDFLYDDNGQIRTEDLPGTFRSRFIDSRAYSYIAKLTYLFNADHNLSLTVVGSPSSTLSPKDFNDLAIGGTLNTTNATSVSFKYTGGFFDKHLLIDATAGWFHMESGDLPDDGSSFNSTSGAASIPAVNFIRESAGDGLNPGISPYSINAFENLPAAAAAMCEAKNFSTGNTVNVRGIERFVMNCPATGNGEVYTIGGKGYMETKAMDRIQARASATYLLQLAGHHIFKGGIDFERLQYDVTKAYSGGVYLQETETGETFTDFAQYGYLTGPNQPIQQRYVRTNQGSSGIGLYLQDSWSIMDVVTVNAGVRYENQQLFAADGALGLSLNNMLSPRIGVIYDFTQQGRSKLYANYARYYEAVPVNIADRLLTGENAYTQERTAAASETNPGCNPLNSLSELTDSTKCNDPRNLQPINGSYQVSQNQSLLGSGKTPVDPNIKPQSSDELVFGGEYEIISDGRLGATYTRRWMNSVVEDMSLDEGQTYFIGNPGEGMASAFPKPVRDYDAVTVYFNKSFSDGWMGQVSYTWSSLRGNYNGLYRPETAQLDPNGNSDFDLISLLENRTGPLDADLNHYIKVFAAKQFEVTSQLGFTVGLSYTGHSGRPLNYYAAHAIYGQDESFVLPRGSAGRLPWRHEFSLKSGVSYRINKEQSIDFTVDVFNLFNFQAVTAVDQTLTTKNILPAVVPAGQNPQEATCLSGNYLNNPQCANGTLGVLQKTDIEGNIVSATQADLNPNFKKPTAYQSPISVRFGVRFTF